ncbi:MAG: hypothetical protein ACP6IP_01125 [Candidatus Njordarchaeia archaeon]
MEVNDLAVEHSREFVKEWLSSLKNNPLLVEPIKKYILSELKEYAKEKMEGIVDISHLEDISDLAEVVDRVNELSTLELVISGLIYSLASGEKKLSGVVGPITKGVILTSFKELNKKIWKDVQIEDKSLKGIIEFYIKYLVDSKQIEEGDVEILEETETYAKIKIRNDPFVTAIKHILDKLGDVDVSNICLRGLSIVAFIRTITDETVDMKVDSYSDKECIISLNFF